MIAPTAEGRNPLLETERELRLVFESAEALEREYAANLASSGVFIETDEFFEPLEAVTVALDLAYCQASLRLEGEVVHIVPTEMASVGAKPGVAVQLKGSPHEVRKRLEPLLRMGGVSPQKCLDPGRRAASRSTARLPARLGVDREVLDGHTRNLSRSGVLLSVGEAEIPVGKEVRVTLPDPTSGREMQVEGRVIRQVRTDRGELAAVGVQFEPAASRRAEVDQFIDHLQAIEHKRQLGSTLGPIDDLGAGGLIQMFARAADRGTLFFRSGDHEGLVGFEGGLLRYARVGSAKGVDAIQQLLSWERGEFEFRAHVDPIQDEGTPPVEAAVLEAARRYDEARRTDPSHFPPGARLRVAGEGAAQGKVRTGIIEDAILDLARAHCTVQRLLEVLPEPDAEIYAALTRLIDAGAIRIDS